MFTLVAQPAVYPSVELLGLPSERGYVDTGAELPAGGRVYLGETTVSEAVRLFPSVVSARARELGMVDGDEHAHTLEVRDARIAELETELAEWAPVIAKMAKAAEQWETIT